MEYHYKNLKAYDCADQLAHAIFDLVQSFPKNENYITVDQIKRSSLSVVLNIVEGNARRLMSKADFSRFLKISYGSLIETEYLIEFCFKRGYLNAEQYNKVFTLAKSCGGNLWMLIKSQG